MYCPGARPNIVRVIEFRKNTLTIGPHTGEGIARFGSETVPHNRDDGCRQAGMGSLRMRKKSRLGSGRSY